MMLSQITQKILVKTFIAAGSVCLLLYPSLVHSAPPSPSVTQNSSKLDETAIEEEKPIYPIAEKLIRANGLDDHPWLAKVENEFDTNAFAQGVNQITIFNGLLDQVDGDPDALAGILAHEIAHHTLRHHYWRTAFVAKLIKQLETEVDTEVQGLISVETKKFNADKNLKSRRKSLCQNQASSQYRILNCQGEPDTDKLELIKQKITAEKQAKFESAAKQLIRQQEFEADAQGYFYMVKAGYNPEGLLRVFNLMSRLPYVDADDSTHPSFVDRINAIKALMKKYPPSTLVEEGAIRLRQNPQPLTFGVSRDGESLRINSRFGSQQTQSKADN
ncbi:M48 family metallopeptidase [Calothrix sp. PCC 7507]|uniref:M48 family metallopeptidase n=1 Tax=Calothrix sp. PCC 7507 TaxID=99598 RepID=UPI00029F4733|nr:M48 family metallopeptidase [Calothrix sp. PCC 7507]AFY34371.1 peptidase M48 Ste24p [Calothrix sp. PCC 7507]